MDRRTLIAIGITVGLVGLVLASMASGEVSRDYGKCSYATLGLVFMGPTLALLGAFACAVYLSARGSRPVAYVLLVVALPIVAGGVEVAVVQLSELCAHSGSLGDALTRSLFGFGFVATPTSIAALVGLAAGWTLGRLVRWHRER